MEQLHSSEIIGMKCNEVLIGSELMKKLLNFFGGYAEYPVPCTESFIYFYLFILILTILRWVC